MGKRKKRLVKQIRGLEKQKEKHEIKVETEKGKLDTTPDYWRGEISDLERQIEERWSKLIKLRKKKSKK